MPEELADITSRNRSVAQVGRSVRERRLSNSAPAPRVPFNHVPNARTGGEALAGCFTIAFAPAHPIAYRRLDLALAVAGSRLGARVLAGDARAPNEAVARCPDID